MRKFGGGGATALEAGGPSATAAAAVAASVSPAAPSDRALRRAPPAFPTRGGLLSPPLSRRMALRSASGPDLRSRHNDGAVGGASQERPQRSTRPAPRRGCGAP